MGSKTELERSSWWRATTGFVPGCDSCKMLGGPLLTMGQPHYLERNSGAEKGQLTEGIWALIIMYSSVWSLGACHACSPLPHDSHTFRWRGGTSIWTLNPSGVWAGQHSLRYNPCDMRAHQVVFSNIHAGKPEGVQLSALSWGQPQFPGISSSLPLRSIRACAIQDFVRPLVVILIQFFVIVGDFTARLRA